MWGTNVSDTIIFLNISHFMLISNNIPKISLLAFLILEIAKKKSLIDDFEDDLKFILSLAKKDLGGNYAKLSLTPVLLQGAILMWLIQ